MPVDPVAIEIRIEAVAGDLALVSTRTPVGTVLGIAQLPALTSQPPTQSHWAEWFESPLLAVAQPSLSGIPRLEPLVHGRPLAAQVMAITKRPVTAAYPWPEVVGQAQRLFPFQPWYQRLQSVSAWVLQGATLLFLVFLYRLRQDHFAEAASQDAGSDPATNRKADEKTLRKSFLRRLFGVIVGKPAVFDASSFRKMPK